MGKEDGWTKTPNIILDAMLEMNEAELKLTVYLVRETYGRHKKSIRMTYDEMQAEIKLSRGGVASAVESVIARGFFARGNKSMWYVNSLKNELKSDESLQNELNPTEQTTETVQQIDQSGLHNRPYYTSANKEKEKEYIYNGVASEVTDELPANQKPEPSESRVQEMIGALSQISKQKYIAERDNEFRPVAVKLVKDGFTVGDVAYFGVWWSKNRHYPGKPALKTIFDNIDRVIDERDNPTPAVNGVIKDDTSGIWVRVVNALSTRNYNLLTETEKNAVRAVGIDRIKGRNNFTESQLRGEFFKALQGVTA